MRRRAFLSVLCGAVTWPLAVAAQQSINEKRLAIFSPSESLVRLHAPSADLREHSESKFYRAFFAEALGMEEPAPSRHARRSAGRLNLSRHI